MLVPLCAILWQHPVLDQIFKTHLQIAQAIALASAPTSLFPLALVLGL
jgi:hypothetical protein